MTDMLLIDDFKPLVGDGFKLRSTDGVETEIVLESVTPTGSPGVGKREQAFSLLFHPGTGNEILPQQTFELTHEKIGTVPMFLVPIQAGQRGVRYEAVFS